VSLNAYQSCKSQISSFHQFFGEADAGSTAKQHAFTVDVEDWYHGIPVDGETKASAERRLQNSLGTLLELLAECGVRGTFFWLGPVAIENPHLVQEIAQAVMKLAVMAGLTI
jgi:hypothetical protein